MEKLQKSTASFGTEKFFRENCLKKMKRIQPILTQIENRS